MDGRLADIILVFLLFLTIALRLRAKAQENVEIHRYAKDGGKRKPEADKCTSFQGKTKFIDKQLTGHVIFNASIGDTSIVPCVQWCLYVTACKAVSFYKPNKQCIMYDVDSTLVADQEFEDLKGSIFSDISLWHASLVGSCQSRPCSGYEMCLPVLQNYACINIDCGPLPRVPFSTNNASGTTFGTVVEYTCVTGFVMKGPATTSCMANRKWTSTPECQIGHIGETSCMDNTSVVIGDSRTCNKVFGTGCACVQGKCLCTEAGYIPNTFNIACVQGHLGTTDCETRTNLVKSYTLTCNQIFGTGSTCVQGKCVCSEAGYVPNLTNTACKQVSGYLGTTNCMDVLNVISHDTQTCEQFFGTGSTCVHGKCVCSEAGYVPNLTNTACEQGYLGTTNCEDITSVVNYDTRTCEQLFGARATCAEGKCVCSAGGYVPDLTRTSCVQGYLGEIGCDNNTHLVTNYTRTCAHVFGKASTCFYGHCECIPLSLEYIDYVPTLNLTACVLANTSAVRSYTKTLNVTNGGGLGEWGDPANCPPGTFASGYILEREMTDDIDKTGLNDIRMFCSDIRGLYRSHMTSSISYVGREPDWSESFWCETPNRTFLVSFQLQVEGDQGNGDDTSVNYVKFKCRDFAGDNANTDPDPLPGNGIRGEWGSWSQTCDPNSVICGLRTRVQSDQGDLDDTTLNDVMFYCCSQLN